MSMQIRDLSGPAPTPDWSVTGTQSMGASGQARVDIRVTGRVTGKIDQGGGTDAVRVAVWDDGEEKDVKIVTVPLGATAVIDVRLGFSGRYETTAGGIGITVVHGTHAGAQALFALPGTTTIPQRGGPGRVRTFGLEIMSPLL